MSVRQAPAAGLRAGTGWPSAWCLVVLLAALANQARLVGAVWASNLLTDEPAHFTTGVMVHDYLWTALGRNPVAFAESFYARFPKVAIGHWPPAYYVLQAVWYLPFGTTVGSARALSVAVCVATAAALFLRLRRSCGADVAALSAACYLALPSVQASSWQVMSDLLVSLLVLLAALAFSDFLRTGRDRHAWRFAAWAVLAILTKGSAWALGIFALAAPALAGRPAAYRRPVYWLSGCATVLLAAPFYVLTARAGLAYPADPAQLARGAAHVASRLDFVAPVLAFAPALVFGVAAAGVVAAVAAGRRGDDGPGREDAAVAVAWILSQLVFLVVLPLTEERRYFAPSAALLMLLFGHGLRGLLPRIRSAGAAALTACCFVASGVVRPYTVSGYGAVARAVPFEPGGTVMLVASDQVGEGAFIAERLAGDRARDGVVLRGSKVLASSTWSGSGYRLLYPSAAEVAHYMRSVPVRYVVLDGSATPPAHEQLVAEAVRAAPDRYRLVGTYPVRSSAGRRGDVAVFEDVRAPRGPAVVRIDLGPEHGHRVVEYAVPPAPAGRR